MIDQSACSYTTPDGVVMIGGVPYEAVNIADLLGGGAGGCGTDNDKQTLNLTGTTISISNGNSIDLAALFGDGAGIPDLVLDGTLLSIAGGTPIDLAPLLALVADDQTLSLKGSVLTIADGNSVDLSSAIPPLTLTGTILSIGPNGAPVDLSSIIPPDKDDQVLGLAGLTLDISNGNSVNLGQIFVGSSSLGINPATGTPEVTIAPPTSPGGNTGLTITPNGLALVITSSFGFAVEF